MSEKHRQTPSTFRGPPQPAACGRSIRWCVAWLVCVVSAPLGAQPAPPTAFTRFRERIDPAIDRGLDYLDRGGLNLDHWRCNNDRFDCGFDSGSDIFTRRGDSHFGHCYNLCCLSDDCRFGGRNDDYDRFLIDRLGAGFGSGCYLRHSNCFRLVPTFATTTSTATSTTASALFFATIVGIGCFATVNRGRIG